MHHIPNHHYHDHHVSQLLVPLKRPSEPKVHLVTHGFLHWGKLAGRSIHDFPIENHGIYSLPDYLTYPIGSMYAIYGNMDPINPKR